MRVIDDTDRAFDFFKKGELDYYSVNTARMWAEEMDFEAVRMGWAHRKRLFVDYPQGVYGFAMNLERPDLPEQGLSARRSSTSSTSTRSTPS